MSAMQDFDANWGRLRLLGGALSRFLSPAHKRQLLMVSLWACGLSALEMLVAAAVIPYVACLNGQCPVIIESTLRRFGWSTIPALSFGLFLLICLKLGVQAALAWSGSRFNQQVQRDTVSRLLESYLHLDWMGFRSESRTHYFRRCATTAVDAAYVSQQCVTMISSTLMLVFLSALMLWQYPLASLLLALGFLLLNALTHTLLNKGQKQASRAREAALQRWNTSMAEAFASFREIRVYGLERFFLQHIDHSIEALASANVKLTVYPTLPRLVLDFAVLGILLGVVSLWMLLERPLNLLLPQLIFYAVVARALLPAMMSVLGTRTALFGAVYNIELVLGEMERAAAWHTARVGIAAQPSDAAAFTLERVTFRHAPHLPAVLEDANLYIAHPSWIAIVGPSGTGKSTLMELLCGIHQPQSGSVRHAWPAGSAPGVAYVPQHVALLDDSIEQNVVFGFDGGDGPRVDAALRLACLDDVVARLPGGRNAAAGADGARLSGGERQRLALARALYRQPDLLLLDEATSGLDEATETRLLSRLRAESPAMSVVYITHRSSNLRFADRTLRLRDGFLEELPPDAE
ncbi:ABC transporter ATP-binding protein [Pseudomonas sp.]|uniref:ABC transporter ATP-binding protein n=1 Tax=Pseudomonas sp. TaxID=306 RepID=UPI0028AA4113|nr:ABC transporter ATP-binding protein [Pseudomonas sp.]